MPVQRSGGGSHSSSLYCARVIALSLALVLDAFDLAAGISFFLCAKACFLCQLILFSLTRVGDASRSITPQRYVPPN